MKSAARKNEKKKNPCFLICSHIFLLQFHSKKCIHEMLNLPDDHFWFWKRMPLRCLENSEIAKVSEFKYLCRRDVWSWISIGFKWLLCPSANLTPYWFFRITTSRRTPTSSHSIKSSQHLVCPLCISTTLSLKWFSTELHQRKSTR